MGRHFEVRALSIINTANKKNSFYIRVSKEIATAIKLGNSNNIKANLLLKNIVEKYHKLCPKEIINRAINKKHNEGNIANRYEFIIHGNIFLIIDVLTDNINRTLFELKNIINKYNGHIGNVVFNFTKYGIIQFNAKQISIIDIENLFFLNDINLIDIKKNNNKIELLILPEDLLKVKNLLKKTINILEFDTCDFTLVANNKIIISDKKIFINLLNILKTIKEVKKIYHNVTLI